MLSPQDMKERRTLKRIAVPGVSVKYKTGNGLQRFIGASEALQVINMSKSGIALELPDQLDCNTPINLKVKFPDGVHLDLKGRVRWSKSSDVNRANTIGVQFNPFGHNSKYNPIKALEYLRSMKDQAIELPPDTQKNEH